MDNLIWTGELLISDGAHSVGLCCQIEHTYPTHLRQMVWADCSNTAKHHPPRLEFLASLKTLMETVQNPAIGEEFIEMDTHATLWSYL